MEGVVTVLHGGCSVLSMTPCKEVIGHQFTCFTCTKAPTLTQKALVGLLY
jgi:hypothetical protein